MHTSYYDTKYTSSYDRVFTYLPNSTVSSIQRKFSGHPLFFRASASCSKILNNKKYTFNTVNSGQPLFFRASASCSKILNVKSIFNAEKYFRATLFFRANASCSKILNDKKYMFNTVKNISATQFFRASACKLLKTPECIKYIQYSEKFQGKLCFSGQAQVTQNSEIIKNTCSTQ